MKVKRKNPKMFPGGSDISKFNNIKLGIDPTHYRLHVGHLAALHWLKTKFKKNVTIVMGVHTARLGDPSGQDKTRPILDKWQVRENTKSIKKQVKKILPWANIVHQRMPTASWLMSLAGRFTVKRVMSRHNFATRESVSLHELLVPLIQASDSLFLGTTLEIGGEDQLFNFELTREVQKAYGQEPEQCALFPIITGTDGQKMSKSSDNCIWLDDPQIKDRVMSISDEVMDEWLPLFHDGTVPSHPKERKEFLSKIISESTNNE